MPAFTLSLCICTRNRPQDLHRCLTAVAELAPMPHQVLISDDGDPATTVEAIVAAFPFAQYQRGPRKGVGANRNAAIASVTGSYVAFIDDDVIVPVTFIAEADSICRRHAALQPQPIITGVEYRHTPAGIARIEAGNPDFWGFQRIPPEGHYRSFVQNATIFPASLFRVARFDPQLRYGSEEVDLARHAVSLGFTILAEPAFWVDHYPSSINREEYAKVIEASRMYATAKDYWSYQKNIPKALFFLLVAPLKLIVALSRRFGFRGLWNSLIATATASRYLLNAARQGN